MTPPRLPSAEETWHFALRRAADDEDPVEIIRAAFRAVLEAAAEVADSYDEIAGSEIIGIGPPLCITRDELDWAFERVKRVFVELG